MPDPGTPEIRIELCERHGLRYNAATHDGCVRCRKEAGETLGTAPVDAGPVAETRPGSLVAALVTTVALIVAAGATLQWLHARTLAEEVRQQMDRMLDAIDSGEDDGERR